jgi:chromosome segregation ATPase
MAEQAQQTDRLVEGHPAVTAEEAQARIGKLEADLSARDSELAALKKSAAELEEKLASMGKALTEAVDGYRSLVLKANPGISEELVAGATVAAINESLGKAKQFISRVKQSVEKEIARARVPLGASGRQPADLSALSPREKIRYGVGGKK